MFLQLKSKVSFNSWFKRGVVILIFFLLVSSYFVYQLVVPAGPGSELKSFTINSGQSVKEIGRNLKTADLIRSSFWFEAWVWFTNTEKRFGAGEYRLSPHTNLLNLVRLLTGASVPASEITITFPEGWTSQQMADYLQSRGLTEATRFMALIKSPENFKTILTQVDNKLFASKPAASSLEGYLFPDTYRFYREATVADLVTKMLINFQHKFTPSWLASIKAQQRTVHEVVTLASIVEREVSGQPDRELVADIFWRRLKIGQGLQADSTINYITGKKTASVSLDDLKLNSPYNTYRYRGLPPGPISNPGESALRAVLYPTPNQYWYFLTTPEGKVIYSKTFEEHKAAKQKYLK